MLWEIIKIYLSILVFCIVKNAVEVDESDFSDLTFKDLNVEQNTMFVDSLWLVRCVTQGL